MSLRSRLEPSYVKLLQLLTAGRGVAWQLDGKTTLRIDPRCRWIRNPAYEAAVVEYLRSRPQPVQAPTEHRVIATGAAR